MIYIESTATPGKLASCHHDWQETEVLIAYPADRYAIWQGTARPPRRTGEDFPDLPDGLTLLRAADPS